MPTTRPTPSPAGTHTIANQATTTTTWKATLTALSSIAHGGETRGTTTLLRRESVMGPDGSITQVPIISGNSVRGRLRRIGEELLRDVLTYEGHLSPAAAHALRGGGALAKVSGEPLSGSRLQNLRTLLPHIGVFGAAGGGVIIDGALSVGKVVPHLCETTHITGVESTVTSFGATQIETYVRQDDTDKHAFTDVLPTGQHHPETTPDGLDGATGSATAQQMLYRIETFPAGTTFSTWFQLRRATDLETAYFTDVLAAFAETGRIGGRLGAGHGQLQLHLTATHSPRPPAAAGWAAHALQHRAEILTALEGLR